jgi:hypothetical protein
MKPTRSQECREGNHKECIGKIERTEFDKHDTDCLCACHDSKAEHRLWRLRGKEVKEVNEAE